MSVYSRTARFDTGRALTDEELHALAPSIFATTAHASRSQRFRPIPTIAILHGLMAEGFMPVGAKQSVAFDGGRRDFTKHLIRLRRLDDGAAYRVGDTVCEIILRNANDGSSAYELLAGLFRICCLNSLVAQTGTVETHTVRHSGDVQAKVIEGTYHVLEMAQKALAAPRDWAQILLSANERQAFAESAHRLRFERAGSAAQAINPASLLVPRRGSDCRNDLWTTFNVVQENAIKGGLTGSSRDANNRERRTTTRPVNGIDQDVRLNRALFMLAAKMADLKARAAA